MAINKITEKTIAEEIKTSAHILVTQPGDDVATEHLRRVPISLLSKHLGIENMKADMTRMESEISSAEQEVFTTKTIKHKLYSGIEMIGSVAFRGYVIPININGAISNITIKGYAESESALHVYLLSDEPSTLDDIQAKYVGYGSVDIGTTAEEYSIPIEMRYDGSVKYIAIYCNSKISSADYRSYVDDTVYDISRLAYYISNTDEIITVGEGNNGRWSPNIKIIEVEEPKSNLNSLVKHTTIYVSATGNDETGDGTEKNPYATIYYANETITDNGYYNRYTIKVADGTYDDLQTRYAGTYSGSFEGVITKDFVEYVGNIDNPENVIIQWDGLTGFASDTFVQVMGNDKCPFHIVGSHVSSTGEMHTAIRGFTIDAKNIRYALHIETSGYGKGVEWEVSDCIFKWHGCPNMTDKTWQTPTIGTGSGHFEKGRLLRCKIVNDSGITDGFRNHDSLYKYEGKYATREGAEITLESCVFNGGESGNTNVMFRNIYADGLVDGYNRFNIINCTGINKLHYQLSGTATVCDWRANIQCSDIATNQFEEFSDIDNKINEAIKKAVLDSWEVAI